MSRTWRLVREGTCDARYNMAMDTALADAVASGDSPPTLRLYRWDRPSVSIGRLQDPSNGIDLAFYEEAVLYPLRRSGCRNHVVFVDAHRYNDTLTDLRGSVTSVGRRYILIPISLGSLQAFHPKLILLLGRERGRAATDH